MCLQLWILFQSDTPWIPFEPSLLMSFAQELAAASMSAQEKFFQQTVENFMTECKYKAAKGFCSCSALYSKPSYLTQESLEILRERLHELGLVDVFATMGSALTLKATWKLKPQEQEKTGKGTSSMCPVCFENGHVVVLTPCGHVVCKQCQASQKFQQCPMCRQGVTGATKALFL